MKLVTNVIAISILMAGAAHAAQPAALATLVTAAGPSAAIDIPAAPAPGRAVVAPLRGLESDVTDLAAAGAPALISEARAKGYAVFQLDGAKMTTKKALMAHAAAVLDLPKNMDNWDAMIDYMGDMPQIHANDKILIVVKNASLIQRADPKLYYDLRDVAELSCRRVVDSQSYPVAIKFAFVP